MNKPVCCIETCYDNIYLTIEKVATCIKENTGKEQSKKFKEKAVNCTNYDQVLGVAKQYVQLDTSNQ